MNSFFSFKSLKRYISVLLMVCILALGGKYVISYMKVSLKKAEEVKVTFPEGYTNVEMADLLSKKLRVFDRELFLKTAKDKEGYLFPDTYNFFQDESIASILEKMNSNFKKKTSTLANDIKKSGHTLDHIVIMASIVELEAKKSDSPTIAGILWKRENLGMPLQVDADKATYTDIGLPAHPLANPGLSAIEATLNPEDTAYLYYLHDKNGIVHYARTYEEHKRNIQKYLK
jgi:UPF0755 protein